MPKSIRDLLNGFHDTTMFLALGLWVCVAPLVLLFTAPFFGWQGGLTAVVLSFLIALALCWGICLFPRLSGDAGAKPRRFGQR